MKHGLSSTTPIPDIQLTVSHDYSILEILQAILVSYYFS